MSISELLGLDDQRMTAIAVTNWDGWQQAEPRLGGVPDPARLAEWRWEATRQEANVVLLGLAHLAACDGGDDRDAAALLAWLVLPAVLTTRRHLRQLAPDLDQLMAAQLWQEVRTLPWQRPTFWVTSRVCWRLRDALRRESSSDTAVPVSRFARGAGLYEVAAVEAEASAAETLAELLAWARRQQLISEDDRLLLLSLVAAARELDAAGQVLKAAAVAGLSSVSVSERVARQLGITGRAVRRRTRRCIGTLALAAPRFFEEVAA